MANNWDIVCIAPEFTKGLDDYRRFIRKHRNLFGICDDGVIEKGVGHVHAALTESQPEWIEGSIDELNAEMLTRSESRQSGYESWGIGEPYSPEPIRAVEIGIKKQLAKSGFPPFRGSREQWTPRSLATSIGKVVLQSLQQTGQISPSSQLRVSDRAGGYVRVFLREASDEEAFRFCVSLREAVGPFDSPRYVVSRSVDFASDSFLNRWIPGIMRPYLQRRRREMVMLHAVPTVLAINRDTAEVFQRHWNREVSPGRVVYARNDEGRQLIGEAATHDWLPKTIVHDKEMFL